MKYSDGSPICVNDKVLLENNEVAEVVYVARGRQQHPEYSEHDWSDIKDGILVITLKGALVQFYEENSDQVRKLPSIL